MKKFHILKQESNQFLQFIRRYQKVLFFVFFVALLTYFIKISCYSISIDTEAATYDFTSTYRHWVSIGRWALVLLGKIFHFGNGFNPMLSNLCIPIFLTLAITILSYTIWKIVKEKQNFSWIIGCMSLFVITSPVMAENLNFTLQSGEVSLGIVLTIVGVYLTELAVYQKQKICFFMALFLLSFTFGIYQSLIVLYISLMAFIYCLKFMEEKKTSISKEWGFLLKILLLFLLSYLGCFLFSHCSMAYLKVVSSPYLTGQITWGKIPITKTISLMFECIKSVLFPRELARFFNQSYVLSCLLLGIVIVSLFRKKKDSILSIHLTICLLFLMISPFLLVLLLGNGVVIRSYMNLPFVTSFCCIFFFLRFRNKKYILIFLSCFVLLFGAVQWKDTVDLFYSDYIRYEEDKRLAQDIIQKIDIQLTGHQNREKMAIVFLGNSSPKSISRLVGGETMSVSFFEWDRNFPWSNGRIYAFMATLGYLYQMPTEAQLVEARTRKDEMGVYPAKDSILIQNNLIIVKLSEI